MTVGATVADAIARRVATLQDSRAVLYGPRWLTTREVADLAAAARGTLADHGAEPGDRVVLWLPNSAILLVLTQAVLAGGLVRVGLSPLLRPAEVAAIAAACSASVVCCDPSMVKELGAALIDAGCWAAAVLPCSDGDGSEPDKVLAPAALARSARREPADSRPDDPAMILFSSGTTGRPKGVEVSHAEWMAHSERMLSIMPPIADTDVVLLAASMSHFGGSVALDCYLAGAAIAPLPWFRPTEVLDAIGRLGVTVIPLAPVMLSQLAEEQQRAPRDLRRLRSIPYAGSTIARADIERACGAFPGRLLQVYGLAEALAPLTRLSPDDHDAGVRGGAAARRRLESAGRALDGVGVSIGPSGELRVPGSLAASVFWPPEGGRVPRPRLPWYATGDLAKVDDEGYVYIRGRLTDTIITGSFNVAPGEVEACIRSVAGVRDVCVVGVPDERWGERIAAAIVADEAITGLECQHLLDAVLERCAERLASFKRPRRLLVVGHFPLNAAGKVDRRRLRQTLGEPEALAR